MTPSLLFLMLVTGSCLAHYRGSYDTRNFIVREEPMFEEEGVYVECPVCDESEHWTGNNEKCPFKRGNKTYKKCMLGTYTNTVCGGKLDCYRGPGEQCTVKWEFDMYGKKCAPGYLCNKSVGRCTGPGYTLDSNIQKELNRFPYTWQHDKNTQSDEAKYFEGIRNKLSQDLF